MAQPPTLEGTWEEIKQHESELIGYRFRLTPLPDERRIPERKAREADERAKRPLQGMGAFKGKLGGTEALFRDKQEEIRREERRF